MDALSQALESQLLLLTKPQSFLRRLKIRNVIERRLADTWHEQPLATHWAATIGLWGGVERVEAIRRRAGATDSAYRAFKQRFGLTVASRSVRDRWELAASCFLRWEEFGGDPKDAMTIAAYFGVLPIELRIYVDRMRAVVETLGVPAGDILDPEFAETLRTAWAPHDAAIDGLVVSSYSQIIHE